MKGKYVFKTTTSNDAQIAFLYQQLTEEDEEFVFTSPVRSWRRMEPKNPVNPLASQGFYCHEMPDNCGNYATLGDCLIRKLDSKYEPHTGSDAGDAVPGSEIVTAVFAIGQNTYGLIFDAFEEFFTTLNLEGDLGSWAKGGFCYKFGDVLVGFHPTLAINNAIIFNGMDFPTSLIGATVGYSIAATRWDKTAFAEPGFDVFYLSPDNPDRGGKAVNDDRDIAYYREESRENSIIGINSYGSWVSMTNDQITECNADVTASDWFYAGGGRFSSSLSEQHVFYDRALQNTDGTGYVVFKGSLNQLSDFTPLLDSAVTRWGLSGPATQKVVSNSFGCSYTGIGGLPPDPNPPEPPPPVTSAKYFGRYSEIFLNFQKGEDIQVLKLPIRFPTRATKVEYADPGFYMKDIPIEGGKQKVDFKWNSELFRGIVEIDEEFIWVKILYAPFRQWKPGEKPYAAPYGSEGKIPHPNGLEWTLETRRVIMSPLGSEYETKTAEVVPQIDWFNRCRVFKIQKKPLQILEDITYNRGQNQAISESNWSHEITNSFILLDHRSEIAYLPWAASFSYLPHDGIVPANANLKGWGGNPLIYPQLGFGVDLRSYQLLPPGNFPPYLKPQESWTELDWIFYFLSEMPRSDFIDFYAQGSPRVQRNLKFGSPGKFSGYGRIPFFESPDYNPDVHGNDHTQGQYYLSYIDNIVEYNRFLLSIIFKQDENNKKLDKILRIKPGSFPKFLLKSLYNP